MSLCIRTAPVASKEALDMMWNGQEISGMARIGDVTKIALRMSKDRW